MNSQRIFTRTKLTALAASAMLLTACGSRESSSVSMVTDFAEEYRTSSAESLTENDNADIGHLRGIVRIVSENAVRIGTEDNNTQYTVSFGDEFSLADIHPGDLADITYSGEILEMYPSLIYGGESLEVIDLHSLFNNDDGNAMQADGIHPTVEGHRVIDRLIAEAVV